MQRFSIDDGPGIRTTVFLEGCPLRCAWCQNPEAFGGGLAPLRSAEAVIAEVLRDVSWYAVSGGGLTLSGGEPLLHLAPALALLEEAKRHRLHTCVQTCGAVPSEHLTAVLPLVDLFQFDLKHFDSRRHRELTGAGTERIHQNAGLLLERGAPVEFRMPLLPGLNDDARNLGRLARFLRERGVDAVSLVPYHRLYLDKYAPLGLTPRLPALAPATAADLARTAGLLAREGVTAHC